MHLPTYHTIANHTQYLQLHERQQILYHPGNWLFWYWNLWIRSLNIETPVVDYINKNQKRTPIIWENVRLDVYTHNLALEYIKKKKPKLVYIAYGETDDFAHGEKYDFYINSLNYTDNMIAELWGYVQSNKFYKDNT